MSYLPKALAPLMFVLPFALAGPGKAADIYPPAANAKTQLDEALAEARMTRKRILLDFGGNWCTDCRVLDIYFHDATNGPLLQASFVLVHINVGRLDENLDIADRYHVPLRKGVPALAVLGANGELLYSQGSGEFQAMRTMQPSAVTEFLLHWSHP